MNLTSFGRYDYDGDKGILQLPRELLKPLGVSKGTMLTALFYGHEFSTGEYRSPCAIYGFMASPIAKNHWPVTARFTIKLVDRPGSLNEVAKIFEKNNATLGLVEGGITGYRYMTWNVTASFNDIVIQFKDNDPGYNTTKGFYKQTKERAELIAKAIRKECKDLLFTSEGEISHKDGVIALGNYIHNEPVTFSICTSLTYFWRLSEQVESIETFPLFAKSETDFPDNSGNNYIHRQLIEVVPKLKVARNEADKDNDRGLRFNHSPVYASVDTKDQSMRFWIMPKPERSLLWSVQLGWETTKGSLGLTRQVTDGCKEEKWNIWHINSGDVVDPKYEKGQLNLLIETQPEDLYMTKADVEGAFRKALIENLDGHINMTVLNAESFDAYTIRKSSEFNAAIGQGGELRFLISAAGNRYEDAHRLVEVLNDEGYKTQFIHPEIKHGNDIFQDMRDIIRNGDVLLVLVDEEYGTTELTKADSMLEFSGKTLGIYSEYEVAMAFAMEKVIVPVAYGMGRDFDFSKLSRSIFGSIKTMGARLDFESRKAESIKEMERIRRAYYSREIAKANR